MTDQSEDLTGAYTPDPPIGCLLPGAAPKAPPEALSARQSAPEAPDGPADGRDAHDGAEGPQEGSALLRAHVALAEQAGRDQAALTRVREVLAFAERVVETSGPGPAGAVRAVIERLHAALNGPAPDQPAHDGGPPVAEAAADDAAHWDNEHAGEGA